MQKISIGSIDPANANPQMSTWTTSDPNVALVLGDGTVLAVAQGGATITCTVRDVRRECVVAVGEDTRPKPIAGALVADIEDQEYTEEEIQPEPTVTLEGATLAKDVDYVLTYTNNVEEGTATVVVTGIGDYYGTVTKEFNIVVVPDVPTLQFTTAQLVLGKQIVMRFGLSVPEGLDVNDGEAQFEIGGRNARSSDAISLSDADTSEETGTRGFYFELSSVEMAEPITCTFYYGNGETVSKTCSVKDYVELVDERPDVIDDPNMIACVHAMANYGHYVQPFLAKYSPSSWTLGTDYKEMNKFYPEMNNVEDATAALNKLPEVEGLGKNSLSVTFSLSLNSYTTFDVYLAPKNEGGTVTVSSAKFGNSDTDYEAELQPDGRYRIHIEGLKASQLNNELIIEGTAEGDWYKVLVRPIQYATTVLRGSYDNLHKEAMAALYYYYYWSSKVS